MSDYYKSSDPKVRWYLESVSDSKMEWKVSIDPIPFIIGRSEDANLNLADHSISRQHTEIRISGNHLWIRDMNSTNGTFLNHKPITSELVKEGDIISIGKFRFSAKKSKPAAASHADETLCGDFSEEPGRVSKLEPKLRKLIRERNIIPHFQPILNFLDKTIAGYEVLGRISDKDLPSNPAELFDIAECLGLSSELSSLFREVGVNTGKNLPGSPMLFVNTTPIEVFQSADLLKSLENIRYIAPDNAIILEINEKSATDVNVISKLRNYLSNLNIGLAFDDFGTGQTRLVELANVPPDYLKFDISLIREIHLAPQRLHDMISTFVKAAKDLGIKTVAEGIERQEEAETCRCIGFDCAQGFYYGKPFPMPKKDFNLDETAKLNQL